MQQPLANQVDHLFRNEYGRVVAIMTNRYGISYVEQIEDVVQDSFLKAMQVWGYQEVPQNPTAWLFRVANNAMIDKLRKGKKMDYVGDVPHVEKEDQTKEVATQSELSDSQLKLIFACCHPSLSKEYQIILSLKLIGGFSNKELAEALLKKEGAVAKSFTRAKKKFKAEVQMLKIPVEMGLQSRLFVVLRVIYLLFTEGYAATSGAQMLKKDICYEALRLALLLRENTYCQHANLEALIALMCFHAARFDARLDDDNELVTLAHQDRALYNQELVRIGVYHLENSNTGNSTPSNYHFEAAISYYHCTAKTYDETDWENILRFYDLHLQRYYSPIVALNRMVPFAKVNGPKKALVALEELERSDNFETNGLFYAIKAELMVDVGDQKAYRSTLQKAIALTKNTLVKRHLERKMI
ncbi:MAG: sigma-70 family RNA polymerase sigma factor [Bacteroidota bacterium]